MPACCGLSLRQQVLLRVLLRVLARQLVLVPLLGWVCRGQLEALRVQMTLLRWGGSRRGKRSWKRWLMPPLVQFPLLVERRRVELKVLLVRMVDLVSRHLQRRWSQFGSCS